MGDRRDAAARAHTWKQGAVADASSAKNDVLAIGQIVCRIETLEIFLPTVSNQFLSFLLIARPHFALHVATETLDAGRCEHRFRRTADAHVKIHGRVWQRRGYGRSDISIANHAQRRAG